MRRAKPELNPQDFIITRKRKKYRFALFHNASNCFELETWHPRKGKNLTVEIGAGTGLFLVELAALHPERTYIALDVKGDRLQKGAIEALERELTNIFFVRARADQLLEIVKPHTVSEIWLTFSDPFPKKRDAKKRLTHPRYLEIFKNVHVRENAHMYMKTDNHALFDWSLEQFVTAGWNLNELSYDLHDSSLSDEYKIMTSYERRWISEGLPIYFAHITPRAGQDAPDAA